MKKNEILAQKSYVAKIKKYRNGDVKIVKYNEEKTKTVGIQEKRKQCLIEKSDDQIEIERKERRERYAFEVKNRISDIIKDNQDRFEKGYFCTFTFDPKQEKGLSLNEKNERRYICMKKWLNSEGTKAKYHGLDFSYLVVPEYHEGEGENHGTIHFHGIIGNTRKDAHVPKLEKTTVKFKGDDVFNLVTFKYGFTNATKVQDSKRVANYIRKYITKELVNSPVAKGKKKYWASHGLTKPKTEFLNLDEFQKFVKQTKKTSHPYEIDDYCKIWEAKDLDFESRRSFDETFEFYERESSIKK